MVKPVSGILVTVVTAVSFLIVTDLECQIDVDVNQSHIKNLPQIETILLVDDDGGVDNGGGGTYQDVHSY